MVIVLERLRPRVARTREISDSNKSINIVCEIIRKRTDIGRRNVVVCGRTCVVGKKKLNLYSASPIQVGKE